MIPRLTGILDTIDTREFLVWATLKQREEALSTITILPDAEGREALESYVTGMFGDLDLLLQRSQDPSAD